MSTITVVRADRREALPESIPLAPRGTLPERAVVTIVENGKPNGRRLLELLVEELSASLSIGEVRVFAKPAASSPITPEEARGIAASSDLVLAGLGDCGACSACSLHDAVQLEALGVPSALIITDPFQGLIAEFALSLGVAAAPVVSVPHPISSRKEPHLREVAQRAVAAVREQLVGAGVPAASGG